MSEVLYFAFSDTCFSIDVEVPAIVNSMYFSVNHPGTCFRCEPGVFFKFIEKFVVYIITANSCSKMLAYISNSWVWILQVDAEAQHCWPVRTPSEDADIFAEVSPTTSGCECLVL